MSKNVYILPKALFNDVNDRCNLIVYETNTSSEKNKVIFNQNLICIIHEGEKKIFNSLSSNSFGNNHVLLLNAGANLMSQNTFNKLYCSTLVFFSNKIVEDVLTKVKTPAKCEHSGSPGIFSIEKDTVILNYEESLRLNANLLKVDQELLQIKIEEFLLYSAKKYPDIILPFLQNALTESTDLKFKSFITTHIDNNLKLEELAFLAGMSLSTFKRKFTQVYKASPGLYFSDHRMKKAAKLLMEEHNITEVAFKVGYESLSSFSTEFKKYFGKSPKMFSKHSDPIK